MARRPWYKRFPSDFIAGTLGMSLELKGAYSMLLDAMYDRQGPVPYDVEYLRKLLGVVRRDKIDSILQQLVELGKLELGDGKILNRRFMDQIVAERRDHHKKVESGRRGGAAKPKISELSREDREIISRSSPEDREKNEADLFENSGLEKDSLKHTRSQTPESEREAPTNTRNPTTGSRVLDSHCRSEKKRIDEQADQILVMVERWNSFADRHGLPKVQKITKARRSKAKARLKDCGGLDGWEAALQMLAQTFWLTGESDGAWRPNFDFLLQESSFTKLREGAYRAGPRRGRDGSLGQKLDDLATRLEGGGPAADRKPQADIELTEGQDYTRRET